MVRLTIQNIGSNTDYNEALYLHSPAFKGLFVLNTMIEEEKKIMEILAREYGNVYFEYFGKLMLVDGMDIRTAIWKCWNDLKCNTDKNG